MPDYENDRRVPVLTRALMSEGLHNELGLNKREAKELVQMFFEVISESLGRGEEVKLSGFGNFLLKDKRERPGRNPKTNESVPVSARRVVTFRAGQKLKAKVKDHAGAATALR